MAHASASAALDKAQAKSQGSTAGGLVIRDVRDGLASARAPGDADLDLDHLNTDSPRHERGQSAFLYQLLSLSLSCA